MVCIYSRLIVKNLTLKRFFFTQEDTNLSDKFTILEHSNKKQMNATNSQISTLIIEQWIDEHSEFLLKRALFSLSVKEDAEDVVQEVFLSLCEPKISYNEKSSVRTWLTAILNNKIADFYKKKYKITHVSFHQTFDDHGEWIEPQNHWECDDEITTDPEFSSVLEGCMDKLPPQWKIIVGQAYFSGAKAFDICQSLNISHTNYWKILQRSRIHLKKCLNINWFNS